MSKTRQTLDRLRRYESRNVTYMAPDGSWPIVWERARGMHVWDVDGKKYLDLTGAFGVAAAGHANVRVMAAGRRQMARLPHAMGDVHPHRLKAELAAELSRLTFERWSTMSTMGGRRTRSEGRQKRDSRLTGKTIFCSSGFEAVEAALKTAFLFTGKPGVIAFEGAYHGLGYGALNTTHRAHFRSPFRRQLREFGDFLPFPAENVPGRRYAAELEKNVARLARRRPHGAILVEPVQARGGIRVPPPDFLRTLRRLCGEHGLLLIVDEIYTGFGRTGRWFACEHSGVIPDLVCVGKALAGGFPLSACVGRADLMDAAWPLSTGEAIHTSTFLGHPVGCAMALQNIREITRRSLVARSASTGLALKRALLQMTSALEKAVPLRMAVRGLGLMAGLELRCLDGTPATRAALGCVQSMLRQGFVLLPEGEHANVIGFTPPLVITKGQIARAVAALQGTLRETIAFAPAPLMLAGRNTPPPR